MNKFLLVSAVLFTSCISHAGSNGCSNTSNLTWYQDNPYYTFATGDCVVNATQGDQANPNDEVSLLAYLPASPNDGDQYTLVDTTPYSLDDCLSYYDDPAWGGTGNTYTYCSPAGIGMTTTTSATIGNSYYGEAQEFVDSEIYYTNCVDPNNNPCSLAGFPTQQRDSDLVTYNASTNNWDLTVSAAQ